MNKAYRQQDELFSNVLLSLRTKPLAKRSLDIINTRVCTRSAFAESCFEPFLTVVATNKEKDEINLKEQERLEASGAKAYAYETTFEGMVSSADLGRMPKEIIIHCGEQVMCTCNCEDYQNGTMGIVEGFSSNRFPIVRSTTGKLFEVKMHQLAEWVPEVTSKGTIEYKQKGSVTLLGCRSAYAATIHKIQGLTLDKLYIQLGRWIPESGLYVALSRCRHLEDIGISRPIVEGDIKYSEEAMSFLSRFSEDAA